MQIANSSSVSKNQLYLLASAQSVDANSLAATSLIFQNNMSAAISMPACVRIIRRTGIISLAALTLSLNGSIIKTISATTCAYLGSTANQIILHFNSDTDLAAFPSSGSYSVTVTALNTSSATFDIEVYGIGL